MNKIIIRALLVAVLSFCGIGNLLACGGDIVSSYATKPFDIFGARPGYFYSDYPQENPINSETVSFWKEYTAGNVTESAIEQFFKETSFADYDPDYSRSPFIEWLLANNKKDALEYIGYCLEYNAIADRMRQDVWQYEQPDMSAMYAFYQKIKGKKGKGTLGLRYKFLKVRALASLKNDSELISFWNKEGGKMPDTALGRRIKGYIGGAYYRQHDYVSALDYFDSANDPNSVGWCVEKLVGARNLANLYEHAPNSVAINYILQDYVNYLIEAIRDPESFSSTRSMKEGLCNMPIPDPKSEINDFLALSDRALSEGRVENPMVWATAKGIVLGLTGRCDEALAILESARTLEGTKAARENLDRFCGWALLMTWNGSQNQKATQLASFIKNYTKLITDEWKAEESQSDNGYIYSPSLNLNFLFNFFASEAVALFKAQNPGRATLFLQFMDDLSDCYDRYGFLGRERSMMWEGMPVTDLQTAIDFTEHPLLTDVDRLFETSVKDAASLANDVMGTRLMTAGKFKEAIPYLQKVRIRFLVTTATYPYLCRGYYRAIYDYSFQRSDFDSEWSPYWGSNPKLEYCKDIVKRMEAYNSAAADEK